MDLPTTAPWVSPDGYAPTAQRPLRAKQRLLEHRADIQPHRHAWAQLVFSIAGAVRVSTEASTYIVPPSRAVWIPPGLVHAVTAIEQADLRTVYLGPALLDGPAWLAGRVLEVSPLLRELVLALPTQVEPAPAETTADAARRSHVEQLVIAELKQAAKDANKRIRALNRKHGVEAITTATGSIIKDTKAYVLNVGDSQVWHFSKDGSLKNATRAHCAGDDLIEETGDANAGLWYAHLLTSCLGTREAPLI
ncbi:MAG: AraC family ligand binding domain-containing protein, partial [Proteobacteria bacterium]|nr:AraC family ligand binding domain-containing protein [Pseudomonadota bacterium]